MLENFLADLKASLTASPIVKDIEILDEFITSVSGFLDCRVLMIDGSELFVSEYITILKDRIKRDKYSYHLQKNDELIIRWDNAPHHREVSTFPDHVHRKDGVHESKEMTAEDILEELSVIVQEGF
ncbi:MAG: DUF6516 family protein [Candidatus Methanoperedens sp.]|nr:DUF6516 family protein [Candidatus Methanoperedens sp.]MCZ7396700.1 DUF6516 family protein [Candidatus Methanoperedens sp.]